MLARSIVGTHTPHCLACLVRRAACMGGVKRPYLACDNRRDEVP
jgi:hypothetical protein